MPRLRRVGTVLLAAAPFVAAACGSSHDAAPPLPVIVCDSRGESADERTWEHFAPSDVAVRVELGGELAAHPTVKPLLADLGAYLGRMGAGPVAVSTEPSTEGAKLTIIVSTLSEAQANSGHGVDGGYGIKRVGNRLYVVANDDANLVAGTYALLEELGARFFHPREEYVPSYGEIRVPRTLELKRRSPFVQRGVQLHTLHPIEYTAPLNLPGAENLAEAKQLVDWVVKTGQNHLQWVLMETAPLGAHTQAILDYAHGRGVTVGAALQVWGGASLQNNLVLVKDEKAWQEQMDAGLTALMAYDWDVVELALGEFLGTKAESVVTWLDHATAKVGELSPKTQVNVQNHVGNYAQLYVDYQGQKTYYYHLPKFCDPKLGQSVHTLSLFDLYRDWATYAHPNFHAQHDYLLEVLATRRTQYFPESAYWITADIDVPFFLPETIHSRWLDIHSLDAETKVLGLPPLYGHLLFSSGHEWGFWMTDYLTAKMLWEPERGLDDFFAHVGGAFGTCGAHVATSLSAFTALQTHYLFDERLLGYVQGEDVFVDMGYAAGLETHPKRIPFQDVLAMTPEDRDAFEAKVVDGLDAMAQAIVPLEDDLAARCRGADDGIRPWCDELRDGYSIVRLRLLHASALYRAILERARGGSGLLLLDEAARITEEARVLTASREGHYRVDAARLTGAYKNPTRYAFGYLRQAHTMCLWTRQELQVSTLLVDGVTASVGSLPKCQEE